LEPIPGGREEIGRAKLGCDKIGQGKFTQNFPHFQGFYQDFSPFTLIAPLPMERFHTPETVPKIFPISEFFPRPNLSRRNSLLRILPPGSHRQLGERTGSQLDRICMRAVWEPQCGAAQYGREGTGKEAPTLPLPCASTPPSVRKHRGGCLGLSRVTKGVLRHGRGGG